MLSVVERLKTNQVVTVMQFPLKDAQHLERGGSDEKPTLVRIGQITVPPWSKLIFKGFAKRDGRSYPVFRILRFDKLVDMNQLTEVTPAILDAKDFGISYFGSYVVLEPEQAELLDV